MSHPLNPFVKNEAVAATPDPDAGLVTLVAVCTFPWSSPHSARVLWSFVPCVLFQHLHLLQKYSFFPLYIKSVLF